MGINSQILTALYVGECDLVAHETGTAWRRVGKRHETVQAAPLDAPVEKRV